MKKFDFQPKFLYNINIRKIKGENSNETNIQ